MHCCECAKKIERAPTNADGVAASRSTSARRRSKSGSRPRIRSSTSEPRSFTEIRRAQNGHRGPWRLRKERRADPRGGGAAHPRLLRRSPHPDQRSKPTARIAPRSRVEDSRVRRSHAGRTLRQKHCALRCAWWLACPTRPGASVAPSAERCAPEGGRPAHERSRDHGRRAERSSRPRAPEPRWDEGQPPRAAPRSSPGEPMQTPVLVARPRAEHQRVKTTPDLANTTATRARCAEDERVKTSPILLRSPSSNSPNNSTPHPHSRAARRRVPRPSTQQGRSS
jgi:hypothetical protein